MSTGKKTVWAIAVALLLALVVAALSHSGLEHECEVHGGHLTGNTCVDPAGKEIKL